MTDQLSPSQGMTPDPVMSLFGYVVAAGVALVLLPVLPFIAVLWLLSRLGGKSGRQEGYAG